MLVKCFYRIIAAVVFEYLGRKVCNGRRVAGTIRNEVIVRLMNILVDNGNYDFECNVGLKQKNKVMRLAGVVNERTQFSLKVFLIFTTER